MENNTVTMQNTEQKATFNKKTIIRSFVSSLVINGGLPLLIYYALTHYTTISGFAALVLTGIPSLIDSIVGIIRRKRIDFLAGIVLFGIFVSLVLISLGGSQRLYLVRDSLSTGAYGLLLLVSLPFPRPIGFYTARYFMSGNNAERIAWFNDTLWPKAPFRAMIRQQTAIWGIGVLLEAALRTYLAFTIAIPQFLAISPIVNWGFFGTIFIVAGLSARWWRKRHDGLIQSHQ